MIEVLIQILSMTLIIAFPILAIVANFMKHRLDESDEREAHPADFAGQDETVSFVLSSEKDPRRESSRAA